MIEFKGLVKEDWQQLWDVVRMTDIESEKSLLAISLSPRSDRMQYGLHLTRKLMQELGRSSSRGAAIRYLSLRISSWTISVMTEYIF